MPNGAESSALGNPNGRGKLLSATKADWEGGGRVAAVEKGIEAGRAGVGRSADD